jgi:CHAD domain-containing protein
MNKAARLSEHYLKACKDLRKRMQKLQTDPSPDNVHDLRTSIRRVEAIVDLLPKKSRKTKKMRKYLSDCKQLFKSTTPVRDIDVVLQNVRSHSSVPVDPSVISAISRDRSQLISGILEFTLVLEKTAFPKIRRGELSSKEIEKRRDKSVKKLVAKLQEELPIVLGDFRKIQELHDVRKDCKNLRYVLEVLPSSRFDELMIAMKDWQNILGAIRDIDVTQQFAEERGLLDQLEEVLTKLRITRDKMLGSFTNVAKLEKYSIQAEIT